ncbi:MAG: OadG family protein [Prevotellaceae bacterium]|jgi:Na+-transporting methylmalonyl-CoA/oxaloacetate decarboxylase gamma subunit|nr:OadG family protein [Prevotellaceae bacterium]
MNNLLAIDWNNTLTVVYFGLAMVFITLIFLVFIIGLFGKIFAPAKVLIKIKLPRWIHPAAAKHEKEEYESKRLTAEESAAIGMALHLYYDDVHDVESAIITIKKVERRYSPWSSKIYGLNNLIR